MNKTTCYSEFVIQSNGKMTKNGFKTNKNSEFNPDEITKLLNITPYHTTTMNASRPNGVGNYPFSTWSGCKKEEPILDAEKQVEMIVEELRDKIPTLLQIKKRYDVRFFITIVPSIYNEEAPVIGFNKDIIDFCYKTGAEIGVHLYVFDKE